MPQRLFKVGKIGCFVDSYAPGVEKRRGRAPLRRGSGQRMKELDLALAARIRGLRDIAEIENRRSPWRGQGFTEEADRLERESTNSAHEQVVNE